MNETNRYRELLGVKVLKQTSNILNITTIIILIIIIICNAKELL